MVSEGQKHEANYSMILFNNSFLYFMNDYKMKNVETGLWVTSVFKRRPYPIQHCHCLRLFLKKEIEQNFFKHTTFSLACCEWQTKCVCCSQATFSQPFGWNLNKGKLWDLWHCECGDVTHGLFHVAWLNIKVFKLPLKLVHWRRNLKKKNETNHFCLILNRKGYACLKAFIDRDDNKLVPKLTFSKSMVFKAESIDATTLTIEPFSCEKS